MGSAQALMIPSLKMSSSRRLDWMRFAFIGAAWYSWEGFLDWFTLLGLITTLIASSRLLDL